MALLFVFGDSIAYGANDEAGGWTQRLRAEIDKKRLNQELGYFLLYNLGVSGDTTVEVVDRFDTEIIARRRNNLTEEVRILFAIGINDSAYLVSEQRTQVSSTQFRSNLSQLIQMARKYSSNIGFVGLNPVDEAKVNPVEWAPFVAFRSEFVAEFNAIIRSVCEAESLTFVDIWSDWIERDYKLFLEDGLHPNSEGHSLIFDKVLADLDRSKIV